MIPAFFIMGIGPMLSWEKDNFKKIFNKINLNILMTIGTTVIFFWSYKNYTFFGIAGIFLAVWVIINSLDRQWYGEIGEKDGYYIYYDSPYSDRYKYVLNFSAKGDRDHVCWTPTRRIYQAIPIGT